MLDEKLKLLVDSKSEIFSKGDFKGILFAKFESKESRNRSVESFRKASLTRNGSRCWASEDTPVEERACKKFLFGIKSLLIEWGFGKFEIWIDLKNFQIYFNDEFIASIKVNSQKELELQYGDEWESYLKEGKLEDIISQSKEMISRSISSEGKSKGKGKSKSKSKTSE